VASVEPTLTRSAWERTNVDKVRCYVGFDITNRRVLMSALKEEGDERVRAEDAVEIIDCGRASEQTQGGIGLLGLEGGAPPFNYYMWV
jgi:hypothetical protein